MQFFCGDNDFARENQVCITSHHVCSHQAQVILFYNGLFSLFWGAYIDDFTRIYISLPDSTTYLLNDCGCLVLVEQEALKRVLFIFAKLNPGIRYVQGMNEVLAPLYYVFKTDNDESNVVSASYHEQLSVVLYHSFDMSFPTFLPS